MTRAAELVAAARGYLGVPFRHMGRDRHGVDCVGLLVVAAREVGLLPEGFRTRDYSPKVVNPAVLRADLEAYLAEIPEDAAAGPGDVLILRVGGSPQHVALVTETREGAVARLIHADRELGRVWEQDHDQTTRERRVASLRWREWHG